MTIRAALIAAVGVLAVSGCKPRVAAPPPAGPLPVNVTSAIEKEITEWDEYTGRTEAVEAVEIRPRVSGYLTQIHFKAGVIVKKGDLLFTIDPRPYEADLARANAEIDRTTAQLKFAEVDFKRAEELRAKNTISSADFDQKAAVYRQAEASVKSAQASRDSAALNLEFTAIKSPIDGRVSNEHVTVGNLIQPGAGADAVLTTVVSIDPIYVYADVDEANLLKYIKLTAEGKRKSARDTRTPAWIGLGNEDNFPHEGYIDFVDNRVDPNTGTMRARAVFKTWDALLTPGFFVRLRIPGAPPSVATLLDDKVIAREQSIKYVFVVKADNTVERRNVETGPMAEGLRIVRAGLKPGEKVVATRLQLMRPGLAVQPIPAAPAGGK